jgi:hypothetical protein
MKNTASIAFALTTIRVGGRKTTGEVRSWPAVAAVEEIEGGVSLGARGYRQERYALGKEEGV